METSSNNLPLKPLAGDITAAAIAATIVTPSMVIIDRAVVENISQKKPLVRSLWVRTKLAARHPLQLVMCRPFAIMWMLYAATYGIASVSDTLARRWLKMHTAPLYGVPRAATLIFLIRDCFTIFGSVTLPPKVSSLIPDDFGFGRLSKETMSQLMVPVLSQLVASPIHLVGLDMVNRQEPGISLRNRVTHNRGGLLPTTVMRSLRILPSFGLGIITNTEMRRFFHSNFESRK
ncbi:hypothetical protein F4779DRAFT_632262 [Xylariaceae sp. FL0662B]|nr:hypothetical protein F4779DRAFT_632262 [Xylariaceae sp. FL0662B]